MKILIKQFLGKNHSWAVCGWNLATEFIKQGHQVDLFSTDGTKHLPSHLSPNLIGYTEENKPQIFGKSPEKNYDMQFSYTAMKNIPLHLSYGNKNRLNLWCYEFSGKNSLPYGFAKYYKSCDLILPPSTHAMKVFLDSGIPQSHLQVVPHGVEDSFINGTSIYPLKTNKKFKILSNIAQPHLRKNLPGILEAYGKAFTKQDDICLVLKIVRKPKEHPFEIDFNDVWNFFNQKYPNRAEVLIVDNFITDIASLYRACDAFFSMSNAESFLLPALEALACNKIVIVGEEGGQRDFCNQNNSLLISGTMVRADPKQMYWSSSPTAQMFQPDIDSAIEKLKFAYYNSNDLLKEFKPSFEEIKEKYTWKNAAIQILNLCK